MSGKSLSCRVAKEHHVDTLYVQVKVILLTSVLCIATSAVLANNSDNEKSSRRPKNDSVERQLAEPALEKKSLLKVFQLEDSRFGTRGNVRRHERSARLQLSEDMPSETISASGTPDFNYRDTQINSNSLEERSLFHDGPVQRRDRKRNTSRLIKSKLLNSNASPFEKPEPPNPGMKKNRSPKSAYESVREARRVHLQQQTQREITDQLERRLESKLDFESKFEQDFNSGMHSDVDNSNRLDTTTPDAYTDDLPMTDTERLDNIKAFQLKSYSTLEQMRQPQAWQPIQSNGTPSASVSAVMSPLIRHTPNGIEVNFSDSFANLPQESEDPVQLTERTDQQPDDQEEPDWGSILGDKAEVADPTTQDSPSDSIDGEIDPNDEMDESQFDIDDEPEDADSARDEVRKAREIQSIEKQREGYRQALYQPLTQSPAQMTMRYLDDKGDEVPSSAEQRYYLLQFNNYRYSPYYNNECRVDARGMSWCPMYAVWKSPNLCYHPLYFEEVNLERFGARFPYGQPFISAAHFFGNVVTLPYAMGSQPPYCCYYSAGYGRPGNKYSYQMKRPWRSLRGATFQSLLITGLVFGLP